MAINFSSPKSQTKRQLKLSHHDLLVGFCSAAAILVFWLFPKNTISESFFASLIILFVFPVASIKFLLKQPLRNFGLQKGDLRRGIVLSCIAVLIFLIIDYIVIKIPTLRNQINIHPEIVQSFWSFLWLEFVVFLSFHFIWEFFFRGFVQFGLERSMGTKAILLQAILQSLALSSGSWTMAILALAAASAAGIIARQSRSIIYSFASMWIISISLDIMMIRVLQ